MADFSRIYRAPRSQSLQNFLGIGDSPAQPDEMARIASFNLPAWHASLLHTDHVGTLSTPDKFGFVSDFNVVAGEAGTKTAFTPFVANGAYAWIEALSGFHNEPTVTLDGEIYVNILNSTQPTFIAVVIAEGKQTQSQQLFVRRPFILPAGSQAAIQFRNCAIATSVQIRFWGYLLPPGLPPPY